MVPAVDRQRVPALLLVLVALGFVAGAGWVVYDDLRPSYRLTVNVTGDLPSDAEVLDYDSLPPSAQDALEEAQSGPYIVHEDPPFRGTFPLYETVYVQSDGEVYECWLSGDGLVGGSLLLAAPLVAVAIGLALVGRRAYRHSDSRTPLAVLAGLAGAWLVALALPATGPLLFGAAPIVPAAVAFVAFAAAAQVGLARIDLG